MKDRKTELTRIIRDAEAELSEIRKREADEVTRFPVGQFYRRIPRAWNDHTIWFAVTGFAPYQGYSGISVWRLDDERGARWHIYSDETTEDLNDYVKIDDVEFDEAMDAAIEAIGKARKR